MQATPRSHAAAVAAVAAPASPPASSPHTLQLDGGDTYHGAVQRKGGVALPHGHGVWRSADGTLRYEGRFVQRWRDGYGRLHTPDFTLWARWRMDRPDLTAAVRVDYTNGDRYCGFIEWRVKPPAASAAQRSKFCSWAASVEPTRQRWGELVMACGDSYVGEWRDGEREGFGCYLWATGSRYTGRFHRGQFSDVGTLFIAAAEVDGCFTRLGSGGGWRCGEAAPSSRAGPSPSPPSALARWPPFSRLSWDGVIVDGVWADGRCRGEGHVTLPGGVRLSADWRTAAAPVDGELVLPSLSPPARVDPSVYEWRDSFQWESLFTPAAGATAGREGEAAAGERVAALRASIQQSTSAEVVRSCVVELLESHETVRKALHVFVRCFCSLFGTCGMPAEAGSGGRLSGLGWCSLRNHYGGCIHRPRGRAIQHGHLDLALRDIASLARSTVRWVLEVVGPALQAKVLDCGGEAVGGRWVADRVLQHCYPLLRNLYAQVYREEEAALSVAVARLRGRVTLDDMGVLFARQSATQAQLFDPYTDAVHCVEQLNSEPQTITRLLRVLVQWSREIDLSTRLTQATHDGRPGGAASGAAKPSKLAAGSADDLLPIHQYVLSQARCPHLFAVTRLLADFAAEPLFMEATSQEAFGVTTLQVCVLTLMRLHAWERDEADVMVPLSVTEDRVAAAVRQRTALIEWVCAALDCTADDATAAEVASVMRHHAALWLPRLLGWCGEHVSAATRSFSVAACGFTAAEASLIRLGPASSGWLVCVCCWLYAAAVLGALHLRLSVGTVALPVRLRGAEEVARVCAALREGLAGDDVEPELRVEVAASTHLIPSRMLHLESCVQALLSGD